MKAFGRQVFWLSLICMAIGLLGACAATGSRSSSARPVFYPNAVLSRMGEAGAQAQAQDCINRAQAAGLTASESSNAVGQRAGQGAAVGGVAGAVGALVHGRGLDSAIRAGAAGAAVGGSVGAVSGAMQDRPSQVYRHYVQRCLGEKGLDVIGWN